MTPNPVIPDNITDQGLLLAAFILLLCFLFVMGLLRWGPNLLVSWRNSSGHKAVAEELADVEKQLAVLTSQIESFRYDYHERLVPSLHLSALAQLRLAGLSKTADEEEKRVAELITRAEAQDPS